LLWLVGLTGSLMAMAPPMPVYEGCVQDGKLLIMTGEKRVIDQKHQQVDLRPFDGKWIRFNGYLQQEPTLVLVDPQPSVVGPCRGPQRLPRPDLKISQAIASAKKAGAAAKGEQPPPLAAIVEALDAPLHSGDIEGRALLSNHFKLVESLGGRWPEQCKLLYWARVADNERAIKTGERVVVVTAAATKPWGKPEGGEAQFELGLILEESEANLTAVKKALSD
jgi:hypothetical protein